MKITFIKSLLLLLVVAAFGSMSFSGGDMSTETGDPVLIDANYVDMDAVDHAPNPEFHTYTVLATAVTNPTTLVSSAVITDESWTSRLALNGTIYLSNKETRFAHPNLYRLARDGINCSPPRA